MTADVPRKAEFDDLRVGQVVAWMDQVDSGAGVVKKLHETAVTLDGGLSLWTEFWERGGEVTILRDAPAPPVTVRREDYDALVALVPPDIGDWFKASGHGQFIIDAARALIDNADTGDHQPMSDAARLNLGQMVMGIPPEDR